MKRILCYLLSAIMIAGVIDVLPQTVRGATALPAGWSWNEPPNYPATCEIDTTQCYDGVTPSVRFTSKAGYIPNNYGMMWTSVPMQADKTYRFGVWAKAQNGGNNHLSVAYNGMLSFSSVGRTYDWMYLTVDYESTSNGNREVQIQIHDVVKNLWLADFSCREVSPDGTLVGPNLFTSGKMTLDPDEDEKDEADMTAEEKALSDLIKRGSSTRRSFEQLLGISKIMPVKQAAINVDADSSDWADITSVHLPMTDSQVNRNIKWDGEQDSSLDFSVAYDDTYFYLWAAKTDDIDLREESAEVWRGDSVQLAFSHYGEEDASKEICMAHTDAGGAIFYYTIPEADVAKIKLKTSQSRASGGITTFYECAVPWSILYGTKPDGHFLFNILVNDNDGDGRSSFIEKTPGIGSGKSNAAYTVMGLEQNGWYAASETPKRLAQAESNIRYRTYIGNNSDAPKSFTVTDPGGDTSVVAVAANEVAIISSEYMYSDTGEYSFTVNVAERGGVSSTFACPVKVLYSDAYYLDKYDEFEKTKFLELRQLMHSCKRKKISTDYELINMSIIEKFLERGRDDVRVLKEHQRALYVLDCLDDLYEEAKASLTSYLNGTAKPIVMNKYVASDSNISGMTLTAKNQFGKTQPFFFNGMNGYGFEGDISDFPSMGINSIEPDIGPNSTVFPGPDDTMVIDYTSINHFIDNIIIPAEKAGVAVTVNLAPHYVPQWLYDRYPEAVNNDNGMFGGYRINHPKYKEMLALHVQAVMSAVSKYKCVQTILLMNEPSYQSNDNPYDRPLFTQYLKDVYGGDISKLNYNYGTSYTSFDDVPMHDTRILPNPNNLGHKDLMAPYIDYCYFNDINFFNFHKFLADEVKKNAPDIFVITKMMATIEEVDDNWRRQFMQQGTDFEQYAEFADLNGNDANNMYTGRYTIVNGLKWQDMQTSIKNVAVVNSENHIIGDGEKSYRPEYAIHAGNDMWAMSLYGRAVSNYWVYAKATGTHPGFNGCLYYRPDVLAAMGKSAADLNRLTDEAAAIQDAKREVAILYDKGNRIQNTFHYNAIDLAYRAAIFSGQRAGFVTQKMINEGKLDDYDLLYVPEVTHIPEDVIFGIEKYVRGGGKAIVLNKESLALNLYGKPHSAEAQAAREYIIANSIVYETENDGEIVVTKPSAKEIRDGLLGLLADTGRDRVMLIDNETNEPVYDVHWMVGEYQGSLIINICNYELESEKDVSLVVDGKEVAQAFDLRAQKTVGTNSMKLKTSQPLFIRVSQ